MGNKASGGGGSGGKIPKQSLQGSGRFEHAIDDEKGGRKEQDAKASMLNRKALAYLQTGMHSEAETMFDESLKIRRMLNEENTPEFALTLHNLAVAKSKLGRHDAMMAMVHSLKSMRDLDLADTLSYANAVANHARHLASEKQYAEAVESFEKSLALYEKLGEKKKASYFEAVRDMAEALVHLQAPRAAELCRSTEATLDPNDFIMRGRFVVTQARAELATGDEAGALRSLGAAIAQLNRHDPTQPNWLTRKKAGPYLEEAETLWKQLTGAWPAGSERK